MKSPIQIFAHRGASHIYPENTLPAFKEAIRRGATGLEFDVQLSKDGCPVIIHDENLNRTTNGKGLVKNYTVKELKELSAGAWFHPKYARLKIPTLEEVLTKVQGYPIQLNIEMKNLLIRSVDLEKEIIRLIQRFHLSNQTILSSFNPNSLELVRKLDRHIPTGFLYFGRLDQPWRMAKEVGAHYIQPPITSLTADMSTHSHAMGLKVCPYNTNRWADIYRAIDCKSDAVITMYPERVRKFVE